LYLARERIHMDRNQLLELALEALQREKEEIKQEIENIQAELGTGTAGRHTIPVLLAGTRRKRTPAERKARSHKMKQYWAAKKVQAAISPTKAKAPAVSAKVRTKTAAEKKALSLKMKAVWKKRKAAAATKMKSKSKVA
jgi:hypothetical protein